MDIPALSMALSQNRILNDVGIAMLSKSLDNMQDMGAAMVETIEAAPAVSLDPNLGANIDIRV
ncbi:putative motility protein [Butyrivibrio sp. CB08]|uniref:YjfB family protein n=1 Tax=Butyrivibrio sp. CB08 TaxID=2364879 RepID=UPI000EA89A5E|nr:YjfB family protein [Butyrivibrio sp. CB08]RKM59892.1 putative motility protein [Butyrivibrio sp. CB08]